MCRSLLRFWDLKTALRDAVILNRLTLITQLWKAAAQTSTDPRDGQTECTAEAEGEDCPDCAERGHGDQPAHGAHLVPQIDSSVKLYNHGEGPY